MSKFRVLFLGTPDFAATCLQRLLDDQRFEVVGVVSQPDRPAGRKMQLKASPVKELALAKGLRVFTPETVNTEEFRAQVAALGAESGVVVAFGQILGLKFLELFPKKCVNVHGSLLPRWRGAAPIQRALMEGDTESGVALQIVVKKLDAGPVLGARRLPLGDEVNAVSLYESLAKLGAELLITDYVDYLRENLTPVEQDESAVTIAPKIDKAEARLDLRLPARVVFNRIRGLAMGPQAFVVRAGQSVKLHRVQPVVTNGAKDPGVVVAVSPTSFTVACGEGTALEIFELQPESRARQHAADYMRGYPVAVGDRFEVA